MPRVVITLPATATAQDAVAVESLLRKAVPQAGLLVTFMGAGLSAAAQSRVRELLPRATVKVGDEP